MLYKYFLHIFFAISLFGANQLTSPKETLSLLEDIKEDAIVLGDGNKEIHSFIDPKCSMSQLYLKYLYENRDKIFSRYKVYLYLYELKRKDSAKIIRHIFDSEYPETLLKSIMVNHSTPLSELEEDDVDDDDIEEKVARIEEIAQKIGVFKRPYIITNGKGK
jgi:arsenate reductase-like glutaredoxin family protein